MNGCLWGFAVPEVKMFTTAGAAFATASLYEPGLAPAAGAGAA